VILPPTLRPGDAVAVVSLSSAAADAFPHRFDAGLAQLAAALDVTVVEAPHARADAETLDRHPELRARDLHDALLDDSIAAVVSSIGGEDSIRLLPHLDLELIAAHPKAFVGFSDTTVTHMAFLAAGVTSFYGPAVMAGFAENGGMHDYTLDGVRRMLRGAGPPGEWPPNADGWTVEFLDWADPANQRRTRALRPTTGWRWLQGSGSVEGRCVAGCIEVLDWLRGTRVWPDLDGAVLAIETSEEAPEPLAVTRVLRAVAASSDGLAGLRALLLGRPGGAHLDPARHAEYDDAVLRVVRDELHLVDLPVVSGLDFGHTDPLWTLPIGARTVVDCDARTIAFPDRVTAG
jgi:muramoyltetrapeptide carboxypeptidase LdcA involved in peptidoglycan recycling